mgnify:CR=1 FL=1
MLDPDEGSISVVHARAVDAVNRKIRTRVAKPQNKSSARQIQSFLRSNIIRKLNQNVFECF